MKFGTRVTFYSLSDTIKNSFIFFIALRFIILVIVYFQLLMKTFVIVSLLSIGLNLTVNKSESTIEMVYNPTEKDTPLVSFTFHKVRIGFMLFLVKHFKNDQYKSQNHVANVKLNQLLGITKKMKDSFILLRISKW